MKYLSTYKLFEFYPSTDNKIKDETIFTIKDILRDIEDDGFRVEMEERSSDGYSEFLVYIDKGYPSLSGKGVVHHKDSKFRYTDIQKPVEHLISFLKDNNYTLKSINGIFSSSKLFDDSVDEEIGRFHMVFNHNI